MAIDVVLKDRNGNELNVKNSDKKVVNYIDITTLDETNTFTYDDNFNSDILVINCFGDFEKCDEITFNLRNINFEKCRIIFRELYCLFGAASFVRLDIYHKNLDIRMYVNSPNYSLEDYSSDWVSLLLSDYNFDDYEHYYLEINTTDNLCDLFIKECSIDA